MIFHCLRLVCLIVLGLAWTTTLSFAAVDVQSPTICELSIGYDQAYASHNGYDAAPLRAWEDENQSALADTRASFGLVPGFIAAKGAGAGEKLFWGTWNDYPKVTQGGRSYAQVGDRLYTHHAVDRMQTSGLGAPAGAGSPGRSISPNFIEDVIQTGNQRAVTVDGVPRQVFTSGSVEVVTEQGGRIVITVNPFKN